MPDQGGLCEIPESQLGWPRWDIPDSIRRDMKSQDLVWDIPARRVPKCRSWTVFVPFLRFASWGIPAGRVAGISNLDVFHSFFKSQNGHMDPPGPKMSKIAKSRKPTRHEVVRTTWIVAWLTATVRIHVPNREQFIYSSGNSYPKWRFWVWKYRKPAKLTIQPSWIFRKRPFWPFLAKIKCLLGLFTPLRGPFWPFLAKRVKKGQKWPKWPFLDPKTTPSVLHKPPCSGKFYRGFYFR